jgi:hypothetical protein
VQGLRERGGSETLMTNAALAHFEGHPVPSRCTESDDIHTPLGLSTSAIILPQAVDNAAGAPVIDEGSRRGLSLFGSDSERARVPLATRQQMPATRINMVRDQRAENTKRMWVIVAATQGISTLKRIAERAPLTLTGDRSLRVPTHYLYSA